MVKTNESGWIAKSLNTAKFALQHTLRPARPGFKNPVIPDTTKFKLWVGITVALVLVGIFWFDALFYELQSVRRNDFGFEINFYRRVTRLGESRWPVIVSLLVALPLSMLDWSKYQRKLRLRLINIYSDMNLLFFATVIPGLLALLLKNIIGRARPNLFPELGAHHFDFLAFNRELSSFPSGHATTFGATCMVLTLLFPRFWLLWFVVAIVGGITRIMMLSHYPSDMVAGLAFGAGFALLSARWLARRGVMFRFNGGMLPVRKR